MFNVSVCGTSISKPFRPKPLRDAVSLSSRLSVNFFDLKKINGQNKTKTVDGNLLVKILLIQNNSQQYHLVLTFSTLVP